MYRLELSLDWTLEGKEVEKVLEGRFEVASGN
jgi:ethanolamine utilization protein EutQ (cupin superfamily)